MLIKWINHASYLLSYKNINLITDPWIEGRVFNESWCFVSETKFTYEDFKDVTHIWFSHEHPDHFFPPNLKKIPKEYAKNITILYQATKDQKVKKYCENLGFKTVIELFAYQEVELSDGIKILNAKMQNDADSWLFFKTDEFNVLNLNDCVFENTDEMADLKSKIGDVDVLFTQFSYASWVGNPDNIEEKKSHADDKLVEIKNHIIQFKPQYTIPFASYVWFCNDANFHMNEQANRIGDIYEFIDSLDTKPIVLYPGETWEVTAGHNSKLSIEKYEQDLKKVSARDFTKFNRISLEDLQKSADKYINRCLEKNNKRKLSGYKPFTAFLTDHQQAISFSFNKGLEIVDKLKKQDTDIAFHSQNLKYCFDFDWGWDTILVAGTFEKPLNGNFQNFMEYEWIGRLNNQGKVMGGRLKRLADRIITKLNLNGYKNS